MFVTWIVSAPIIAKSCPLNFFNFLKILNSDAYDAHDVFSDFAVNLVSRWGK